MKANFSSTYTHPLSQCHYHSSESLYRWSLWCVSSGRESQECPRTAKPLCDHSSLFVCWIRRILGWSSKAPKLYRCVNPHLFFSLWSKKSHLLLSKQMYVLIVFSNKLVNSDNLNLTFMLVDSIQQSILKLFYTRTSTVKVYSSDYFNFSQAILKESKVKFQL